MIVLALLSLDEQLSRVSAAVRAPNRFIPTTSAIDARAFLRREPADVLVVDPVVGDRVPRVAATVVELTDIARDFPYLPIVFYASDAARALPIIARFPTVERCDAVVAGVDDEPTALAGLIESVVNTSFVERLVRHVLPGIVDTPTSLVRAVRYVLSAPARFETVDDLAAAACMSRRTFDRWLARGGMVCGADLLQVAKAFHAVRVTRDAQLTRDEICISCGVSRPERIESFISRTVGSSYEELVACSSTSLLELFSARLRRTRVTRALIPVRGL